MLIFFCFTLIVLCSIPIFFVKYNPNYFKNSSLKTHLKIFFFKLIIISMIIYIFISNLSISESKLFIIIGCFIFIIFHFIEGFILQNILTKNGK